MKTLIALTFVAIGLNVSPAQPTNAGTASAAASTAASSNAVTVRFDAPTEKVIREATDNAIETMLATIIGGLLAMLGGVLANRHAHKLEVERRNLEDAEFSKNVQSAIRRELEVLGNVYKSGIEPFLFKLQRGDALTVRFSLTQNWFAVFEANAGHLGRLDAEISKKIILAYALLKRLIEDFRINNTYITEVEKLDAKIRERDGERHLKETRGEIIALMVDHAGRIQNADSELKAAVDDLMKTFERRGIH